MGADVNVRGVVTLRETIEADVRVFYEHQLDRDANHMVAFMPLTPADWDAFAAKWAKILEDDTVGKKTILVDGRVAGSVVSFVPTWANRREVGYRIGREYWGRGVATRALSAFLLAETTRPLFASVAEDNTASRRVLEKCGFVAIETTRTFAEARGEEIDEVVMELRERAGEGSRKAG